MIEPINTEHENVVSFRTDSTTSAVDIQPLLAQLREKLEQYPRLRLWIEYVDDHGFSLDTLIEDLQHSFGKSNIIERTAVITCQDWLQQASELAHQLKETQFKSFHYSEEAQALRWIGQN